MTLEQVTDHEPRGVIKLAPPFWGKPRIASWLIAHLAEVQELEDAIWSYLDGLDVDTCGRWVLEGLARIVGEDERPADTESLRLAVKGRVLVNLSDGTPGALAALIAVLAAGVVHVIEDGEEIRVYSYTVPPVDPDVAASLLDEAAAGGKQSCWITGAGAGSFALPSYGDATPDLTRRAGVGTWSDRHG
jgi:hypothetical protein